MWRHITRFTIAEQIVVFRGTGRRLVDPIELGSYAAIYSVSAVSMLSSVVAK
jgi:hypothetical protein